MKYNIKNVKFISLGVLRFQAGIDRYCAFRSERRSSKRKGSQTVLHITLKFFPYEETEHADSSVLVCTPSMYWWMQMNPNVSDLALYDIQGTPGVAADISHINSKAITKVSFDHFVTPSTVTIFLLTGCGLCLAAICALL